jgi:D-alanyl-D-alanine carboxypeptidase
MKPLIKRLEKAFAPKRAGKTEAQAPTLIVPGESCDDLLVLVDQKTPLPESYAPKDLVSLRSHGVSTLATDMMLRQEAAQHLAQLMAASAAGEELIVASAYRSFRAQQAMFDRNTFMYGEGAGRGCARPGHSQHQLGTAVDFTNEAVLRRSWLPFADTSASRWLLEHASEYGFAQAYPRTGEAETGYRWEPWHYRYIGMDNARRLQASGLSLQAFLRREGVLPR